MRSCGNDPIGTSGLTRVVVALLLAATAVTLGAQSSDPGALFKQALRRETVLRQELEAVRGGAPGGLLLERIRVLVGGEWLRYLDFSEHFYNTFYVGVIDLSDIVYFLSLTALALFLGSVSIETRRWR